MKQELQTRRQLTPRYKRGAVGALIVAEPHEYLFSSARDYASEKGYVIVQTEI